MPRSCKANQMTTKVQSMHSQHQKRENYQWSPSQALTGQSTLSQWWHSSRLCPVNAFWLMLIVLAHLQHLVEARSSNESLAKQRPKNMRPSKHSCVKTVCRLDNSAVDTKVPTHPSRQFREISRKWMTLAYFNLKKKHLGWKWRQVTWWKTWEHSLQIEMLRKIARIHQKLRNYSRF